MIILLKRILIFIGAILLLIWVLNVFGAAQEAPVQLQQQECPDGSYNIGESKQGVEVICKLEPTGCPYGDSIPLGPECDKHAEQQSDPEDPVWDEWTPEVQSAVTQGK